MVMNILILKSYDYLQLYEMQTHSFEHIILKKINI